MSMGTLKHFNGKWWTFSNKTVAQSASGYVMDHKSIMVAQSTKGEMMDNKKYNGGLIHK